MPAWSNGVTGAILVFCLVAARVDDPDMYVCFSLSQKQESFCICWAGPLTDLQVMLLRESEGVCLCFGKG